MTRLRRAQGVVTSRVPCTESTAVYERSVLLRCPVERVFAFHRDPANLHRLNPPGVRTVRVEPEGAPGPGFRVAVEVRMFGVLSQQWRVRVAEWEEGHRFVDVAESGPFAVWRHEHRMEPDPESGGTRLTDRVEFRPHGQGLRLRIGTLLWRPQLAFLFAWRQRVTRRLLEGSRSG